MLPGLRNATVFAAAGSQMPYPRFMAGLIPAALAWAGGLLLLGWFGGGAILLAFSRLYDSVPLKVASLSVLAAALAFVAFRLWWAPQSRTGESVWKSRF